MSKRTPTSVRFDPPVADRLAGQSHAGLVLVSTKTFPQSRGFPSAISTSLATLLSGSVKIQSGQVLFVALG